METHNYKQLAESLRLDVEQVKVLSECLEKIRKADIAFGYDDDCGIPFVYSTKALTKEYKQINSQLRGRRLEKEDDNGNDLCTEIQKNISDIWMFNHYFADTYLFLNKESMAVDEILPCYYDPLFIHKEEDKYVIPLRG